MGERASIFQTVQIGVEAALTPGTAVAANKKLLALSIDPAVKLETYPFRATGNKYRSLVVPGKEYVVAPLSGVITYSEIIYPLASLINKPTPAQQGVTAAYLWTFESDTDAEDAPATFTVEQGSGVRAHRFANGLVTGLELAFSRDVCEIASGQMIGAALEDDHTMTAAPTALDLVPVLPTQVDIFLADTAAGLAGATALTRAVRATWRLTNRFGPVFPLATQYSTGFATTVEIEPTLEASLLMEADAEGMALLTNMRAGSTKFMRIQAEGETIEDTEKYLLTIDTALKVENVSPFRDEDGIYAIEWQFSGVHDATWTKAFSIAVKNEQTAL